MTNGIDVSDFQGDIAWSDVHASGLVAFAYAKATEGTDFVAETFLPNHAGCKAVGIPFGAYHFFRPETDGAEQAKHFLEAINGYQGTLLPMVDVEVSDGFDAEHIVTELAAFNATVEKTLGGKRLIIYTDMGFWNDAVGGSDAFSGHLLWLAQFNAEPSPTLPMGWSSYAIWQYADNGAIAGIEGSVDLDRLSPSLTIKEISR